MGKNRTCLRYIKYFNIYKKNNLIINKTKNTMFETFPNYFVTEILDIQISLFTLNYMTTIMEI